MDPLSAPDDIAHIIQLAVAPVFLIAGIGGLLNVLTSRLARVVDRGRVLEDLLVQTPEGERGRVLTELASLDRRMALINWSVSLSTFAALLICMVIVALFAAELTPFPLSRAVALLFILTMAALIGGLILFLAEISIATRVLRVRRELLGKG